MHTNKSGTHLIEEYTRFQNTTLLPIAVITVVFLLALRLVTWYALLIRCLDGCTRNAGACADDIEARL